MRALSNATVLALIIAASSTAAAADGEVSAQGVGLGVAAGISVSPTNFTTGGVRRSAGLGFAWGFFVDIPLISTFYITPAAMLYELDLDLEEGRELVTDLDLNFKFIVPISDFRLGFGINSGVTSAERRYSFHYGLLGYLSYNFVANLDIFYLFLYKRLVRKDPDIDIDNIHNFLGIMFRF